VLLDSAQVPQDQVADYRVARRKYPRRLAMEVI